MEDILEIRSFTDHNCTLESKGEIVSFEIDGHVFSTKDKSEVDKMIDFLLNHRNWNMV